MAYDETSLEKFYVYRSLNNNESWGAVVIGYDSLDKIPNIDFGMRIFAINEKQAIAKAKSTYDKIHAYDSDKENIRRFAAAALKSLVKADLKPDQAAAQAIVYAVQTNNKYNSYFEKRKKQDG